MSYRTKRPRVKKLLTFGAGATLAIAQLGAGCVPPGDPSRACDGAVDDAGNCAAARTKDAGEDGDGGDGK